MTIDSWKNSTYNWFKWIKDTATNTVYNSVVSPVQGGAQKVTNAVKTGMEQLGKGYSYGSQIVGGAALTGWNFLDKGYFYGSKTVGTIIHPIEGVTTQVSNDPNEKLKKIHALLIKQNLSQEESSELKLYLEEFIQKPSAFNIPHHGDQNELISLFKRILEQMEKESVASGKGEEVSLFDLDSKGKEEKIYSPPQKEAAKIAQKLQEVMEKQKGYKQKIFDAFDEAFKKAPPPLLELNERLLKLLNKAAEKKELEQAIDLLGKFISDQKPFLGKSLDAETGELLPFSTLQSDLQKILQQKTNGSFFISKKIKEWIYGITKAELEPKINEKEGKLRQTISEVNRLVSHPVDGMVAKTVDQLDRSIRDSIINTAPEDLEKAAETLRKLVKFPQKHSKEIIGALTSLIEKKDQSFQFETDQEKNEAIEKFKQLRTDLEQNAKSSSIPKQLEELLNILKKQIDVQTGPVPKMAQVAVESAVKPIEQKLHDIQDQIKTVFEPFLGSNSSDEEVNGEETEAKSPTNVPGLFGKSLNFFKGLLGKTPTTLNQSFVTLTKDALCSFLDKAATMTKEKGQLDGEQLAKVQKAVDEAKKVLEEGAKNQNIATFYKALEKLSNIKILLNLLEIPVPFAGTATRESNIPAITELLDRNERHSDPIQQNEINWKQRVDENKKELIKNITYFGTFQVAAYICQIDSNEKNIFPNLLTKLMGIFRSIENDHNPDRIPLNRLGEEKLHEIRRLQRNAFDKALSSYLWKRSDVGGMQKFLVWFLVRTHLLSWITETIAARFLKHWVKHLREDIRNIPEEKPLRPIERAIKLLHNHQNILKSFAENPIGGFSRDSFMRSQMKRPKNNHGFSETELYDKSSKVLVDQYLPGFNISKYFKKASQSIWFWTTAGDSALIKAAKFIPGAVVQLTLLFVRAPAEMLNWIFNMVFNFTVQNFVVKSALLQTTVKNIKHSLYEKSQYTPQVDELILDQLKEICDILYNGKEDPSQKANSGEVFRQRIKELVQNAFYTLDMRNNLTQNDMKEFLKNSGGIVQAFDNYFMEDTIESIVRLLVVVYQSILQKDQLEKQLANAFEIANRAMTEPTYEVSDAEKVQKENEYQRNEQMIQHYIERILRHSIHDALQLQLQKLGVRQETESTKSIYSTQAIFIGEYHFPEFVKQLAKAKIASLQEKSPEIFRSKLETIEEYLSIIPKEKRDLFLAKAKPLINFVPERDEEIIKEIQKHEERILEELKQEPLYNLQLPSSQETVPIGGILGNWLKKVHDLIPNGSSDTTSEILERYNTLSSIKNEFSEKLKEYQKLQAEMEHNLQLSWSSRNQLKKQAKEIISDLRSFLTKFRDTSDEQANIVSIKKNQENIATLEESLKTLLDSIPGFFMNPFDLNQIKIQRNLIQTKIAELKSSCPKTDKDKMSKQFKELDQLNTLLEGFREELDKAVQSYSNHNDTKEKFLQLEGLITEATNAYVQSDMHSFNKKVLQAKEIRNSLPNGLNSLFASAFYQIEHANNEDQVRRGKMLFVEQLGQIKDGINKAFEDHQRSLTNQAENIKQSIQNWQQISHGDLQTNQIDRELQEIKHELCKAAETVHKLETFIYLKLNVIDLGGLGEYLEDHLFGLLKKKSDAIRNMIKDPNILEGLIRQEGLIPLVEKNREKRVNQEDFWRQFDKDIVAGN